MTQNDLGENLEEAYTGENTSSLEQIEQIFKFPNEKTCRACKIPHSRNPLCADISQERENFDIERANHPERSEFSFMG